MAEQFVVVTWELDAGTVGQREGLHIGCCSPLIPSWLDVQKSNIEKVMRHEHSASCRFSHPRKPG